MSRYPKRSVETDVLATLIKLVGMIVLLPFRLFSKPVAKGQSRSRANLDSEKINQQWHDVRELMQTAGSAHFRMAILHADTIFDSVLKAYGLSGNTMGERLQAARNLISPEVYQMVWQAHKVRNRLAHEVDSEVMSWEAREAIASFEQGLRELKAINDHWER